MKNAKGLDCARRVHRKKRGLWYRQSYRQKNLSGSARRPKQILRKNRFPRDMFQLRAVFGYGSMLCLPLIGAEGERAKRQISNARWQTPVPGPKEIERQSRSSEARCLFGCASASFMVWMKIAGPWREDVSIH